MTIPHFRKIPIPNPNKEKISLKKYPPPLSPTFFTRKYLYTENTYSEIIKGKQVIVYIPFIYPNSYIQEWIHFTCSLEKSFFQV